VERGFEQADPQPFTLYQIRETATGEAIGGTGFFGLPDTHGVVTLGYGLVPSARGKGYATEAVIGMLKIAQTGGALIVAADTSIDNDASVNVLRKTGFVEVDRTDKEIFFRIALGARPIIAISCSAKFFESAKNLARDLVARGLEVRTPDFGPADFGQAVSATEKQRLTLEYLEKVRTADVLYVIDVDGYAGISVGIEVGFAFALGKRIIMSEQPREAALVAMADEVVSTDHLIERYPVGLA